MELERNITKTRDTWKSACACWTKSVDRLRCTSINASFLICSKNTKQFWNCIHCCPSLLFRELSKISFPFWKLFYWAKINQKYYESENPTEARAREEMNNSSGKFPSSQKLLIRNSFYHLETKLDLFCMKLKIVLSQIQNIFCCFLLSTYFWFLSQLYFIFRFPCYFDRYLKNCRYCKLNI